jgi:hypothetical protein
MEKSILFARLKKYSASNFKFNNNDNLWYFNNFKSDRKLINIIFPDKEKYNIKFKNNDYNDYRSCNIDFMIDIKYTNNFIDPIGYEILERGDTTFIKEGSCAGEYRNMYWKVKKDNLTYYLMHIKDDLYTKISENNIKKVLFFKSKRPTWRLFQNGYITCTINLGNKQKVYYLHQLIMDVHDEDLTSFEKTVDHINYDKLDNRHNNLRLVNMSVQNANRDKANRRSDACMLPDNLVQTDLPKYVIYRKEILDSTNNKYREYFYISGHSKLDKTWETTKSMKISIREKLKLVKLKIQQLDEVISETQYNQQTGINQKIDLPIGLNQKIDLPIGLNQKIDLPIGLNQKIDLPIGLNQKIDLPIGLNQKIDLPTYYRLSNERNRQQFIYDRKINDIRQTCRMVLQSSDFDKELEKFKEIVNNKYN